MSSGFAREVDALSGTSQLAVFTPGPEDLEAIGPNFLDGRRRASTLETALRTTRTTARTIRHIWEHA
jgi:hypothetical protein